EAARWLRQIRTVPFRRRPRSRAPPDRARRTRRRAANSYKLTRRFTLSRKACCEIIEAETAMSQPEICNRHAPLNLQPQGTPDGRQQAQGALLRIEPDR